MSAIVAADRSGSGKTTVTLSLLAYLQQKQFNIQSFKIGPDYIDPMFHQFVTQKPCRNLDPILTSEAYIKQCFTDHIQKADYALIEGVMGLFDGVSPLIDHTPTASTAHIAQILNLPLLFVIDCSRLSGSVAAIVNGFTTLNYNLKFAGLILNKVASDRHLELLQEALEPLNIPILGIIRRQDQIHLPERHLGLVPTDELPQLNTLIEQLVKLAENSFNWEKLLPLFQTEKPVKIQPTLTIPCVQHSVKIAIARDQAFSFYYQDNLDILQQLGAELIFWSPLNDSQIPQNIQGFYFGGGFPEMFAKQLSENLSVIKAIRDQISVGIPTYAECGGLMYLCEEIIDFENKSWQMVGVLPTKAFMGKRLKLGYYQATTLQNSPLFPQETTIFGHQFHRSDLTTESPNPVYKMKRYRQNKDNQTITEGWSFANLHASYLHLHWGNNPEIPTRFLQQCSIFQ
ncbi:cobyrinate a,c-diamide synthase [Capilliphycus salinus ALCB114379]|uniref:cobyrinate a,c-diamide synthase n=1 Tax=Capilliphycus salinus TaxID=2768948 RepID=UPI0039A43A81